ERQGNGQRHLQHAGRLHPARRRQRFNRSGRRRVSVLLDQRPRGSDGEVNAASRVTMRVLKFGGSSLATPATLRGVARILLEARKREPVIGVVSAFQGITNQLLECARLAEQADGSYEAAFEAIAR